MPELPEVETMRRGILGAVGGEVVAVEPIASRYRAIEFAPRIDVLRRRVVGRRVAAVDRVGKRVVLVFDSEDRLILEPRMAGLVLVENPPTPEHLRLRIDLAGAALASIWYWDRRGLGKVRLLTPDEFAEQLGPERIGPDALAADAATFRGRLAGSRRPIKVALLDQQAIAGIGNLYAAEILFVAGIDPTARCDRLAPRQWSALRAATVEVLEEAVRYEGSSLADGTYRNVLYSLGGYQNRHRVYDREGLACPRCEAPIRRIVQAQRSTFFCPRCQRKGAKRGSGSAPSSASG